ncbi:GYF_domain [Hexamita inflata]|uniref:GYF domain n=1 Tax=Hexamita inflata TaxID=28002 RepID=A0AA86US92_9EUKA|nr:GYF domain [Hexamita inflata]
MSDNESYSTESYSEPEDTAQSSYMSKQTQNQAPKQTQNVQQESSTSDDAEFQKQMKQSITVFNEVKRCGFSNVIIQTGKGYCVQNGIVFTRPYTVPTEDKQTQKNGNDEIEEEQNKINENQTEEQKGTQIQQESNQTIQSQKETNQKETEVEEFNTKEKVDFALEESESVKEESDISIQISKSDDKAIEKQNQEEEKKKFEADKLKQQVDAPKSNHIGQAQMNEQLIKQQPVQTEPNRSQKSAWFYIDDNNIRRGPFTSAQMNKWNRQSKLRPTLKIQLGNGEFFTLNQNIKMNSFFQDHDEINIDQIISNSKQYKQIDIKDTDKNQELVEEDYDKQNIKSIPYECNVVEIQTQTDIFQCSQNELIKCEISTNVIRNEITRISVPPGVEKCINTYLSLRRQGKNCLYIENYDYIENKFTDYRDLQAVGVEVKSVTRIPIIKKEQKDQKESIFAPGAGDSKHNQNQDFNPEAGKNETEAPKFDKLLTENPKTDNYFNVDYEQVNYNFFDVNDVNDQSDNRQSEEDHNQQPNQGPFDGVPEIGFEELSYEKAQPEYESLEKQPDQTTNPGTDSKWSEIQWSIFKTIVFEVLKRVFNIQFQTLQEALIYYREHIVGVEGNATKIHLSFDNMGKECGISEKECNQKFQTLLGKELLSWPEKIVAAVKARILELWQQEQEPDIAKRKKLIKAKIEQEFRLKQQVQYSYKEISNKINYQLSILK